MQDYARYAIDWVPAAGTRLDRLVCGWTGWCTETAMTSELPARLAGLRASARLGRDRAGRGAHAPLVPAFVPAEGTSVWRIPRVLEDFALGRLAIRLPRLGVDIVDNMVVVAPETRSPELSRLIVELRAALAPHIRVLSDITPRRFMLPLTEPMAPAAARRLADALAPHVEVFAEDPTRVADIALMGDPGPGLPWRLLERHALFGQAMPAKGPEEMSCVGPAVLSPTLAAIWPGMGWVEPDPAG